MYYYLYLYIIYGITSFDDINKREWKWSSYLNGGVEKTEDTDIERECSTCRAYRDECIQRWLSQVWRKYLSILRPFFLYYTLFFPTFLRIVDHGIGLEFYSTGPPKSNPPVQQSLLRLHPDLYWNVIIDVLAWAGEKTICWGKQNLLTATNVALVGSSIKLQFDPLSFIPRKVVIFILFFSPKPTC